MSPWVAGERCDVDGSIPHPLSLGAIVFEFVVLFVDGVDLLAEPGSFGDHPAEHNHPPGQDHRLGVEVAAVRTGRKSQVS